MPLLDAPGVGHDAVDELGRKDAGEHADRDVVGETLVDLRLHLPCPGHACGVQA